MKPAQLLLTAIPLFVASSFAQAPLHQWDLRKAAAGRVADDGRSPCAARYDGKLVPDSEGLVFPGGQSDYLTVDGLDSRLLDRAFTFALWFEPVSNTKQPLFGRPYTLHPDYRTPQPGLLTTPSGNLSFGSWAVGTKAKIEVELDTPLATGRWSYAVVVYDGKEVALYIDGVERSRKAAPPCHDAGKGPFFIGRVRDSIRIFKGRMGIFTIDDRAWTAKEVADTYGRNRERFPSRATAAPDEFATEKMEYRVKPKDNWAIGLATPLHLLKGYRRQAGTMQLDQFGGSLERTEKATGFFRTQKIGDRWWLITPEGHVFINQAVVAVSPRGGPTALKHFQSVFGNSEVWANQTVSMLRGLGFNGAGAWSAVPELATARDHIATTVIRNYLQSFARTKQLLESNAQHTGYIKTCIPIFDPEFETYAAHYAQEELNAYRNDPWLLGVFSDNELEYPLLANFLALDRKVPAQEINRRAAQTWLDETTGKKGAGVKDITPQIQDRFHAFVMARYYRIVSAAIRRALPNHLYLGSRLCNIHDKENPLMWEAIGPYIDVISLNYYGDFSPDQDMVRMWTAKSGKPVIITEWYTKGDDQGFSNEAGGGFIVHTQRDRGLWYQHFALGLLRTKNVVGWHWFKYMDNDPSDPAADYTNRDSNKGLVKTDFTAYSDLTELMQAFNLEVYPLIRWLDSSESSARSPQARP